jgi:catechol-2,3-dioxygenase
MASTAFRISRVGHVVLRVRDVEQSLAFYTDGLGLREVGRGEFGEGLMVFLSTGDNHHDLALVQGGPEEPRGPIGLHHFAFKIGDRLDELVAAKADLDARGVVVHAAFDFRVSKALIVSDPDGNTIELYVDMHPEEWRSDPSAVASAAPLIL